MRTYLGRYPCGRCDETCRLVRVRYDRALISLLLSALCRHVFHNALTFLAAQKAAEQHVADRHCLLLRRKCKFQ